MLGPDCYLSLGQKLMGLLKNWVDIGVGKVIKSVSCVVMSVKVLIMCPTSDSSRADFLLELQEKLNSGFEWFDLFDSLGKSSFILGSELWEDNFHSVLPLVKDYVNIWEMRELKLYGNDSSLS